MLCKVVQLNIQGIKQSKFQAVVCFFRPFPSDKAVIITLHRHSRFSFVKVGSKPISLTCIIRVYLGEIEETVILVSNRIITYQTVGCFQFQFRDHLVHRTPEFLIRDYPSQAGCGEESPTFVFIEALGTVVTEVQLCHITAVVTISETTGQTLITVRQRLLQRTAVRIDLFALLIYQQATDFVNIETTIILHSSFYIGGRLYIFPAFAISQIVCRIGLLVQQTDIILIRLFIIRTYIIIIRIERTVNVEIRVAGSIIQSTDVQPFRDKG